MKNARYAAKQKARSHNHAKPFTGPRIRSAAEIAFDAHAEAIADAEADAIIARMEAADATIREMTRLQQEAEDAEDRRWYEMECSYDD